ncbi:MAG: glutathione S-transferase family protein [Hyphomonadaceae bacterium]
MPQPIELYYWPTPNGWKISIALEEMGLPYELKPVNIGAGDQFKPDFLRISPNNRMPAIVDPDGPGGAPISVFESGAILQYLGRKTGQFYPKDERKRVAVDEWLMWQMGGLGPMSGQLSHFKAYAPKLVDDVAKVEYGQARYGNEVDRLYGVLDRRLEGRDYVADDYSIADMAIWPWMRAYGFLGIDIDRFANMKAWHDRMAARPAVQRGLKLGEELRKPPTEMSKEEIERNARNLFGQTAASTAESAKKAAG